MSQFKLSRVINEKDTFMSIEVLDQRFPTFLRLLPINLVSYKKIILSPSKKFNLKYEKINNIIIAYNKY